MLVLETLRRFRSSFDVIAKLCCPDESSKKLSVMFTMKLKFE